MSSRTSRGYGTTSRKTSSGFGTTSRTPDRHSHFQTAGPRDTQGGESYQSEPLCQVPVENCDAVPSNEMNEACKRMFVDPEVNKISGLFVIGEPFVIGESLRCSNSEYIMKACEMDRVTRCNIITNDGSTRTCTSNDGSTAYSVGEDTRTTTNSSPHRVDGSMGAPFAAVLGLFPPQIGQ